MRTVISIAVFLVFAVLGVGLAVLNNTPVTLDYYLGKWDVPLALVVGVAVAVGMLIGALVNLLVVIRLKRQIASVRRQAAKTAAKRESDDMRLVPLKVAI